jgi:hypothetical protein
MERPKLNKEDQKMLNCFELMLITRAKTGIESSLLPAMRVLLEEYQAGQVILKRLKHEQRKLKAAGKSTIHSQTKLFQRLGKEKFQMKVEKLARKSGA